MFIQHLKIFLHKTNIFSVTTHKQYIIYIPLSENPHVQSKLVRRHFKMCRPHSSTFSIIFLPNKLKSLALSTMCANDMIS